MTVTLSFFTPTLVTTTVMLIKGSAAASTFCPVTVTVVPPLEQ